MCSALTKPKQFSEPVRIKQPSIFDVLDIVNPLDKEWDYMWSKLESHRINLGLSDKLSACNFGEVWQYLYTEERSYFVFWKRQCHVFRHRFHPNTNGHETLYIPASKSYLA
ncbi:hypothetical protein ACMAZF_20320 (plasmid) [Psychrobium sp. nBUS_13]|uniref:hypothetical protein n=1 Tax=Psychrobium sp. nBUS_13 TaxID=3395319 RepID=UPI003EBBB3BC